jgi:RNA polymerase sigma-70 factor, ECF subfamily
LSTGGPGQDERATVDPRFCRMLIEVLPHLQAFSRLLCRDPGMVDDLVQETAMRALASWQRFEPGSNFRAWVFTILRHQSITAFRQRRIAPTSLDETIQDVPRAPAQEGSLMMRELGEAVERLSAVRREALILVVVHGLSYEEAAGVCRCAVGTMKSRVGRARAELRQVLLGVERDGPEDWKTTHRPVAKRRSNPSRGHAPSGRNGGERPTTESAHSAH